MNELNIINLKLNEIKRPTAKDIVTINGYHYSLKPLKQFLNTLKHHSFWLEQIEGNLHLHYQNKKSVGIVKFIGGKYEL